MTDETRLAFAHPEARAAATAPEPPLDRISLRDHVVEADIGAFAEERGRRQRLCFDIVVEVAARPEGSDDDVDHILSYDRLTEAVRDELAEGRVNLLETLAEGVAKRILSHRLARRAFVRIQKLDRGPGALGVEIMRTAGDGARAETALPAFAVLLVRAGEAGRASALLSGVGEVVVICPGLPDERPLAPSTAAQWRIDLLALDQAAWLIAASDPRLSVVASRTEMDWSLRQGRPMVWAPAKMLLDAGVETLPAPDDLAALGLWLADRYGAARIIAPEELSLPAGPVAVTRRPA